MQPDFLVIASLGGCGGRWLENMLKPLNGVNVARWLPAMPDEYKPSIQHNPMLRKIDMQNHTLRVLMPLDCLFEEVLRLYPPALLNVVSHFHSAQTMLDNYRKYPDPKPHRMAYLYGCPLKRLRSAIKNHLHYVTEGVVDEEAHLKAVNADPGLRSLIEKTERAFNMQLSEVQRISIARLIYYVPHVCQDILQAKLLDAHMLNFETLSREPLLMQELLSWATGGTYELDSQQLSSLYAINDGKWRCTYDRFQQADPDQNALLSAPYDGEAIWRALSDWQRYFFQETIRELPYDFVDFYDELGIDLSYIEAKP